MNYQNRSTPNDPITSENAMKVLLIIMLISGEGFAVPMVSMEACEKAEAALDLSEVSWSRCEY